MTKVIILGNPEVGVSEMLNQAIDNCHKHGIMIHPSMLADDIMGQSGAMDKLSDVIINERKQLIYGTGLSTPYIIRRIERPQQIFVKPKSKFHN